MDTVGRHFDGSTSLTIMVHGLTASKGDWIEVGGYTKGGELTRMLEDHQRSWIAGDLYGHGDWIADEPGFNTEDISDDLWPSFIARSATGMVEILQKASDEFHYTSLDIVTYSLGAVVAAQAIGRGLPIELRRIATAVPAADSEHDDELSLHNNLSAFSSVPVFVAVAEHDEEVSTDDVRWFFDQIPGTNKTTRTYDSGHSLPSAWTIDAMDFLT
ncbi:MAG: hypothetical protein ACR2N9_11760 [Acidimicrobiia bacterium]